MNTSDDDKVTFLHNNWSPERVLDEMRKRKPVRLIALFEEEDGSVSSAVSNMEFQEVLFMREVLNARINAYMLELRNDS